MMQPDDRVRRLEREKRVADALVQVAEQAGETLALPEVLQRLCRLVVDLVPSDRCSIYLWSGRYKAYLPLADCGTPAQVSQRFAQRVYHPGQLAYAGQLGKGEVVVLERDGASADVLRALDDAEVYALAVTPLSYRSRVLGSMAVGLHQPPGFDAMALDLLRGIARQAASLIANARLFGRVERAAAMRAQLGALAAALEGEDDPVTIGTLVCSRGAAMFGVTGGVLLLREADMLVPSGGSGPRLEDEHVLPVSLDDSEAPAVRAFTSGRPVLVNDVSVEPSGSAGSPADLKCLLAIPLVSRGDALGCVVYADLERAHRFSAETAEEGLLLGRILTAALERARLLTDFRRSEAKFRALIESGRDVVTIIDSQGIIRYESPAVEAMLGYVPDELIDRPAFDYAHRDDVAQLVARGQGMARNSGPSAPVEFRFRHKDGSWRVLESIGAPLPPEVGFRGIMLTSRDVTERKRGERRLAAQLHASRALAEAATLAEAVPRVLQAVCESLGWDVGAMWIVDAAAGVLRCDAVWHGPSADVAEFTAVSRRTEFPPGVGLPGRVWVEGEPAWIPDIVTDGNFPRAPVAAREGLHGAFGFPIRTRAGMVGVMEFFSREIEQHDPALLQMMGIIGHQLGLFLERKAAEEAGRESEERAGVIIETAHDALITMTAAGNIAGWNASAERIFGWRREEVIGQSLTIIVPPQHREAHQRGLRHFLATGEGPVLNKRIEITGLHRDGHEIPIELAVWPLRRQGEHTFSAFVHDISDRKRAEQELEAARVRAETQAEQLREQAVELVQARDAALSSTRAKSEFLANMSHEIRTPMNGILGMTELMLDTPLTPEQQSFAQAVRSSAESLLSVINDILDFSKIEAGKLTVENADFNLCAVMEEVAQLLAPKAHEKGLELSCDIPPAFPGYLRGDPGRIRQVLTNLVGNAIKFTETGEVVLGLRINYETDGYLNLRLWVRDTGIGVPRDRRDAIFDAFTQADGSSTRLYGGTGLGLTICRQIVELMDGRIGLESDPGEGSTFWVEIAFQRQPPAQQTARRPRAGILRGKKVLVVDDNATNRLILHKQLESWGVEVHEARSGAEALASLADGLADGFDLVLLDMHMPEMDGRETAERIKRDPKLSPMPIVLLSSAGADQAWARSPDIALCLTKPVRRSSLQNMLEEVLGRRPVEEVGPSRAPTPQPELGLRILVAEDNLINQRVVLSMVERWGCTADAVANGRDAVSAALAGTYDVILMDLQMPRLDGLKATAEIRRQESSRGVRTPIIATTAHAMPGDRERCLAADMDDYLAKPIRAQELLAKLMRWIPRVFETSEAAPVPRSVSPSVLDLAQLHDSTGGDPELARGLLGDFMSEAGLLLRRIRTALSARRAARAAEAAHALKGGSRAIGAGALAAACQELEQLGRARNLAAARATLARAELELKTLRRVVRAHLGAKRSRNTATH